MKLLLDGDAVVNILLEGVGQVDDGVEFQLLLDLLQERGVDSAQGFFVAFLVDLWRVPIGDRDVGGDERS